MRKVNSKVTDKSVKIKGPKLKLDEDALQRQICLLFFTVSIKIIFSQYNETCAVLIDYWTIEGDDVKDRVKKEISNLLHANIDVRSGRFIA